MLYNEPDFVGIKSLLEIACKAHGYHAIFFPKFHCELNFIEQCWGYSKWIYHEYPTSSKEVDLECNVLASLNAILIKVMHRCVQSLLFLISHSSQSL
jgi:transposase